jgi:hypothetical protein
VKQTAIYFNPGLDIVHILDEFGHGIHNLSQRINQETIQRIKVLAVEFKDRFRLPSESAQYLSRCLPAFERLETLVLVVRGDTEFYRKNMIVANERLRLAGKCGEWKVPAVKAMNSATFESHLQPI